MTNFNPLDRIIYISVPDEIRRTVGNITIDSSKKLPIDLPPGKEAADLQELSWEMIISGMLKISAYDPEHQDIPFYRQFILEVQPNLPAELTQAGIVKLEAREYALAEEIFLALKTLVPEEDKVFLNLALVYENQLEDAKKSSNPEDQETFREKALDVYRELLENHSESADAHYCAGSFFARIENFEKAKEHFELFLGLAPDDERAAEAKEMADKISVQHEDEHRFSTAYDLIQLGKETEALEHIEQYLENHPEVWNAWFIKGWALRRLSRFEEAEEALQTCSSLEESYTDVFNELAICQMELGKFLESKNSLKKALALEPENVKIISNFGVLALKMQDQEQALAFFRAAREIDPNDPVAKHYLETIENL